MIAPMPAHRPESAYSETVCTRVFTPASRAASGLPPRAKVRRPYVVRLRTIQPTTATVANIQTSGGSPRILLVAKLLIAADLRIWVCLFEMRWARPTAVASIARVAINGTTRPYAISTPLTRPKPTPTINATPTTAQVPRSWVEVVVAQTEASPMSDPTDRSMPPPMMTKVIPTVITPMTEACVRMVIRLLLVRNDEGWLIPPIVANTTSTPTNPRLRTSPIRLQAPVRG